MKNEWITKSVSVLLAAVMLIVAAPLSGFTGVELPWSELFVTRAGAAESFTEDCYTYTVTDGEATITDCDAGVRGDIAIPSSLGGYAVRCIGIDAFELCEAITSITIPHGVTTICDAAFSYCTSLASINIPVGVTSLGYNTFNGCTSLTMVIIPDSVTSIGKSSFGYCENLTSIKIPDSVASIGDSAFAHCKSLTRVDLGNGVTAIGSEVFRECDSLTDIYIPVSVTSIGANAFPKSDTGYTCIRDVYYGGTESQWKANIPQAARQELRGAVIHFNSRFCPHENVVNGQCRDCGEQICFCRCHDTGIRGFIYRIIRILWWLFGMNASCRCGVKHY